ncbi:hypothetical protein MNBD_NITROSPINAE05-1159 [hydrothermal vent metagenome]|uniref:Uncharacterized protein n=1 Tax=hydrothermal vent metagenome TaxID=652676 RepID=A0A3B1CMH0_9ZZZZ
MESIFFKEHEQPKTYQVFLRNSRGKSIQPNHVAEEIQYRTLDSTGPVG